MRDRLKLYENGPDKTKIENEDDLIKIRDAQYKDKFNVNRKERKKFCARRLYINKKKQNDQHHVNQHSTYVG